MARVVSSEDRAAWEGLSPSRRPNRGRQAFGAIMAVLVLVLVQQVAPSWAGGIKVDGNPSSPSTPSVGAAPNGVPLVDIAKPNGRGLSHNRFTDFNVGKTGVILNNSPNDTRFKLGGVVSGNGKLEGRSATTILGEVTGGNRSVLQGHTEVHGPQANWILANPNGITCDGCGFINIPRATLSTGRPRIEDESLERLTVEQGTVTIGSGGLDGTETKAIDIISRAVEVNGAIQGGDQTHLRVVAGRNKVDYETLAATPLSGDGDKPSVAIDASSLGAAWSWRPVAWRGPPGR